MIETTDVKLALSRLPKDVLNAREQRLKRAMVLSSQQHYLPEVVAQPLQNDVMVNWSCTCNKAVCVGVSAAASVSRGAVIAQIVLGLHHGNGTRALPVCPTGAGGLTTTHTVTLLLKAVQ